MLTCPDCTATDIDVGAGPQDLTGHRWMGMCRECGCAWGFDDD